MPCYLFKYHEYGTWMPDRPRGYVRRKEGVLPADQHLAGCYRNNLKQRVIDFSTSAQRVMIEAALEAFAHQSL